MYATQIEELTDIVRGECRNLTPPMLVEKSTLMGTIGCDVTWQGETKSIVFAPNPNIKYCKDVWWLGIPDKRTLSLFDAVAVFYDENYSMKVGATAEVAEGNPNKPDYRRLIRIQELSHVDSNRCKEFFYRLNEENISCLFTNAKFIKFEREFFSDHQH